MQELLKEKNDLHRGENLRTKKASLKIEITERNTVLYEKFGRKDAKEYKKKVAEKRAGADVQLTQGTDTSAFSAADNLIDLEADFETVKEELDILERKKK